MPPSMINIILLTSLQLYDQSEVFLHDGCDVSVADDDAFCCHDDDRLPVASAGSW